MSSLKKEDHYHLSIDFTFIDDDGLDATATMEVDANWNDSIEGYEIPYDCPDMVRINPANGNGDEDEIFRNIIVLDVYNALERCGISTEAIVMPCL